MKKRFAKWYGAFLIISFVSGLLPAEARAQQAKINAVENTLTASRSLVFEDSLVPTYNIRERMEHYRIPSVSIAVINNGKVEWAKAYGYADWTRGRAANVNTRYQVASITKSVVGFAIYKMAKNGTLSLQKDVRSYLRSWLLPENEFSRGKTITLAQLLSHTAGLSVRGFMGYPSTSAIPTINQILNGEPPANNSAVVPAYPVNEQFQYSGGGYTLIRKILDDTVSSNFDSLLQAVVLNPINMKNSSFIPPRTLGVTNYAFASTEDKSVATGEYYLYPELAAGGMWSTATDIAQFVIHIQQILRGQKGILSQAEAQTMLTPVRDQYAHGFGIVDAENESFFRHEGENFGFTSVYYGGMKSGKGVVVLTNGFPPNGKPFIEELVNSVAITYQWKGIYNPVRKKLAAVPPDVLAKYVGEYLGQEPGMKIRIALNNNALELTARRPEKMYATSLTTFFLASSPDDQCVFSSSANNGEIDTFEVIQKGKTIIKATKSK